MAAAVGSAASAAAVRCCRHLPRAARFAAPPRCFAAPVSRCRGFCSSTPAAEAPVAAAAAVPAPAEVHKALIEVEAVASLTRKPWLLLERHRRALEQLWDLDTGAVLLALQGWAEQASYGLPTVTGIANVSGNVYFACDLPLWRGSDAQRLSAVKTLVTNVFSHNEIGVDAIVSRETRPCADDAALISELYTFKELRWLCSQNPLGDGKVKPAPERPQPREVAMTTSGRWEVKKRKSLGKYPRALELLDGGLDIAADAGPGSRDCLRHDGFVHQEVEGTNVQEWQVSLAQGARKKAYTAGGAAPAAGCALLSSTAEKLYAGSTIAARALPGEGSISPLQCAMVSMAANGVRPTDIATVVWVPEETRSSACLALFERDKELLRRAAPDAEMKLWEDARE